MYAFQMRDYHVLPDAGGLRQQSHWLMVQIHHCLNVYWAYSEFARVGAGKRAKWKRNNPELSKYLIYG